MSAFVTSNTSAAGYDNTRTAAVTVTAGSLLVVFVRAATSNAVTITDSKGQTWTKHIDNYNASAGVRTVIASTPNAASGSTTVTSTTTGSPYHQVSLMEFSGCDTVTPVDGTASNTTVSGATSWNSGSFTATTNDPVLVGATAGTGSSNPVVNGSWTGIGTISIWSREAGAYRLPGASGSYNSPWTAASGFTGAAYLVVFKGTSGGGGGVTNYKTVTGSSTGSGTLVKKTKRKVTGSSTAAGSLSDRVTFRRALAGSITLAAALRKKTAKRVAGTLTIFATIVKKTKRNLSGTVAPVGALLRSYRVSLSKSGSITMAGALVTTFYAYVAGSSIVSRLTSLSRYLGRR